MELAIVTAAEISQTQKDKYGVFYSLGKNQDQNMSDTKIEEACGAERESWGSQGR